MPKQELYLLQITAILSAELSAGTQVVRAEVFNSNLLR
jgi:hypothetical protein